MFLVSHEDDTDCVQAFAEDTAYLYAPEYEFGVIDYAVRVDVPSCFVLEGSTAKDAVDEILDLIEPDPWHVVHPVQCSDCGAQVGEPCVKGCPNLDALLEAAEHGKALAADGY
jgi:hypothetical protein